MSLRSTIISEIETITRDQNKRMPALTDSMVLMDTDFDSLCFALLVARMEDQLGFDPFSTLEVADLPVTLGDLVALYDRAQTPKAA
jgi:hypothetical protein